MLNPPANMECEMLQTEITHKAFHVSQTFFSVYAEQTTRKKISAFGANQINNLSYFPLQL